MAEGDPPPLTPAAFQVLLALARGRTHGYGIMGFIAEVTEGSVQLGPGTLYRTLARLATDGLVEETRETREDEPHHARRRYYRLTPLGWDVARHEAELLGRLTAASAEAGLLGDARLLVSPAAGERGDTPARRTGTRDSRWHPLTEINLRTPDV